MTREERNKYMRDYIKKPESPKRRKSGDFLSIDEVVASAAKAGLSYGEYVRRYGL